MFIAIPLLVIPVLLYNLLAVFSMGGGVGSEAAELALRETWLVIPMASGARWTVTLSDVLILVALVMLFFELLKSTTSRRTAIINHSLSMVLFIVCLVEFLLLRSFATSTFFLISTMTLLDVLPGFIVTIITARKDFDFAGGE